MGILRKHPAVVVGVGITLLFGVLYFLRVGFLGALELTIYDVLMRVRSDPQSPSPVVMVDIDDDSIEKLGRWPWPRSLIAKGIDKISTGHPKTVGLNFIFSEPEEGAGLAALQDLEARFAQTVLPGAGEPEKAFFSAMKEASGRLDYDQSLTLSIASSGRVILPVFFKSNTISAQKPASPDPVLARNAVGNVTNPFGAQIPSADTVILPIQEFLEACQGVGHINLAYDMDGTARRERLLYSYGDLTLPAYTLRLAAAYLDIGPDQIRAALGDTVSLGPIDIPVTRFSEFLVRFKGPSGSFKRYPFFDVINDKIPPSVFDGKLVLVSASAAGIINPLSTPTDATMPLGEFSAHTLWSILSRQFIRQPLWGDTAQLLMLLAIGLVITLAFPRLKALSAGIVFWGLLALMVCTPGYLFVAKGLWVQVTYPVLMLITGYIGAVSIKYFISETGKEKVEGESAETNRQLGLSFQSQGMLDMAFDKFRRVPVDDQMKDLMYNLALDYERKRQLNKAAAVFAYIETHDPKFKDVRERKTKLMQVSETMVFGDAFLGGGGRDDGLMGTATGTRPTLGRYEVIRQLGKGAMGIVYLGQDPRINRTTAIKTFRFGDDIDPQEARKLKETFFREAESAGTLSHPNIVTIYDAGEEQDLAYIAMEFLEGENLEKYTKAGSLMPIRKTIALVADIADALDYAHQKGIVHRDIKPANIMLLNTEVVKITDFGIARITSTSQTQTGVVKGTPFYMSPEQFSGEKVDGRSDIFSLGTMTYQMLTARLPFVADSPPALMHQIMNVLHPDPRKYNPKIYKPLAAILDKALAKDRDKRYQRAAGMAAHLRELGRRIDAAAAAAAANTTKT